jgi:hypothetical protein
LSCNRFAETTSRVWDLDVYWDPLPQVDFSELPKSFVDEFQSFAPCLAAATMNRDVLGHLFSFLDDGKDLASSGMVCKDWLEASSNETLWKPLFMKYWDVSAFLDPKNESHRYHSRI